jgi:diguanylate cyclase (GGDEF)-like protein/PAS domain S-box-containing protein
VSEPATSSRARPRTLALLTGALGAAFGWLGWLAPVERAVVDLLMVLLHRPPREDVVIVAIDEGSLAAHGRWPWPRRLQAELVERIAEAGPRALGIVLLLSEADPGDPEGDARLVAAVARAERVVLPVHAGPASPAGPPVEWLPFPPLTRAAAGLGHVEPLVEPDGIVRGVRLRAGIGGPAWPAFALCLRAVGSGGGCAPRSPGPPASIAWEHDSVRLVPLAADRRGPTTVAAADLLAEPALRTLLAGRWVLLGVTAAGLDGALVTPGGALPAVAYHARVLEALLEDTLVTPVPPAAHPALAALLGGLAAASAALARRPWWLALFGSAGLVLVSGGLLLATRVWLSPVAPSAALVLVAAARGSADVGRLQARLASMRARHALMLESIGDAVLATDPGQRVSFANPAAERLLGAPRERLLGRHVAEVLSLTEQPEAAPGDLEVQALAAGEARLARLRRGDGEERTVRVVTRNLGPTDERGTVLVLSDVSRQVELARELALLAGRDALTGLANRRLLLQRLDQAVGRAGRAGTRLAVLFVDLDRFKTVNDGLGHGAGDALLVEVARRLKATVRSTDTVGRLGGDEFVVLLDPLRADPDAGRVAGAIVAALAEPYAIGGQELISAASVGIALYPADGASAAELVGRADAAMYRAKSRGGAGFAFYCPELHAAALERMELERGLHRALERAELVLHYQPTVSLVDGRVTGVEALLRWRHPSRGLVGPGTFVGLAEETGLIVPIGAWAMHDACRQAAGWATVGPVPLAVAVNVSARQLFRADLAALVRSALAESGLPPYRLILEITESAVMDDVSTAARVLGALRATGVRLVLDDFGTGHSALGHLKRLPLDGLKIDRSFVQGIGNDADDEAIVRAIVELAGTLRLSVVAEGVERAEQVRFLAEVGCRTAQGFLFGRPAPAEELMDRLSA